MPVPGPIQMVDIKSWDIPASLYGNYTGPNSTMSWDLFERDLKKLNTTIQAYNNEKSQDNQRTLLYEIAKQRDIITRKLSPDLPAEIDFIHRQFNIDLFTSLRDHFHHLGIGSTFNVTASAPVSITQPTTSPTPSESLAAILSNMEQVKIDALVSYLMQNKRDLSTIHSALTKINEPKLTKFLSQFSINYLGGNNSINFKIAPISGPQPNQGIHATQAETAFVLKIENNMGCPRDVDREIRTTSLQQYVTPTMGIRPAIAYRGGDRIARTVQLTTYCSDGDLLHQAVSTQSLPDNQRLKLLFHYFNQMAQIAVDFQEAKIAITDMKNTNLLLVNGTLKMADTKSPIKLKDGYYNTAITSMTIAAPEVVRVESDGSRELLPFVDADKLHAYIIGKNLYEYITCNSNALIRTRIAGVDQYGQNKYVGAPRHDSEFFDYSNSLFSTEQGMELKKLIIASVNSKPDLRPSVKEIITKLNDIQAMPFQKRLDRIDELYNKLLEKNPSQPVPISYIEFCGTHRVEFNRLKKDLDDDGMERLCKEVEHTFRQCKIKFETTAIRNNAQNVEQTNVVNEQTNSTPRRGMG